MKEVKGRRPGRGGDRLRSVLSEKRIVEIEISELAGSGGKV